MSKEYPLHVYNYLKDQLQGWEDDLESERGTGLESEKIAAGNVMLLKRALNKMSKGQPLPPDLRGFIRTLGEGTLEHAAWHREYPREALYGALGTLEMTGSLEDDTFRPARSVPKSLHG